MGVSITPPNPKIEIPSEEPVYRDSYRNETPSYPEALWVAFFGVIILLMLVTCLVGWLLGM